MIEAGTLEDMEFFFAADQQLFGFFHIGPFELDGIGRPQLGELR